MAARQAALGRALLHLGLRDEGRRRLSRALDIVAATWLLERGFAASADAPGEILRWLRKAGLDASACDRYSCLHRDLSAWPDAAFVAQCHALLETLGADVAELSAPIVVRPQPDASTWKIGGRTYVTRGDDLFLLSRNATDVWRRLVRKRQTVVEPDARDSKILGALNAHGLATITVDGIVDGWVHPSLRPAPVAVTIGFDGAKLEPRAPVTWLVLRAKTFVSCGGNLLWAGFALANSREDLAGAYAAQQWSVVERLIADTVTVGAVAALASQGIYCDKPAALRALCRLGDAERDLVRIADELRAIRIEDLQQADEALRTLGRWIASLPVDLTDPRVAHCHESALGFLNIIEVARDWVPMAATFAVRIPNDDIEYTVKVYDGRTRTSMRALAFIKMATWRRKIILPMDAPARRPGVIRELLTFVRSFHRNRMWP